jgi:hypothetical protein
MRILFDQGTPVPLRRFLTGHDVATAYERGWSAVTNGDLIRLAEQEGFCTADHHRHKPEGDRKSTRLNSSHSGSL